MLLIISIDSLTVMIAAFHSSELAAGRGSTPRQCISFLIFNVFFFYFLIINFCHLIHSSILLPIMDRF